MLLRSLFGSWSFQIIPMAWGHACFGLDVFSCQFAKEILRHRISVIGGYKFYVTLISYE